MLDTFILINKLTNYFISFRLNQGRYVNVLPSVEDFMNSFSMRPSMRFSTSLGDIFEAEAEPMFERTKLTKSRRVDLVCIFMRLTRRESTWY